MFAYSDSLLVTTHKIFVSRGFLGLSLYGVLTGAQLIPGFLSFSLARYAAAILLSFTCFACFFVLLLSPLLLLLLFITEAVCGLYLDPPSFVNISNSSE